MRQDLPVFLASWQYFLAGGAWLSQEAKILCSNAKNSVGGAPGKEMACKADGFSVAEIVGKGVEGQNIRSLAGMEQHSVFVCSRNLQPEQNLARRQGQGL